MKRWGFFSVLALLALASCLKSPDPAVIWTDRPEFAVYADYFNTSQDEHKVEVRFFESPVRELNRLERKSVFSGGSPGGRHPDILVASWLKNATSRTLFRPLNSFFRNDALDEDRFYSRLFVQGRIEGRQYFLPVSFNLPAVVFARENADMFADHFVTGLEEIRELGRKYNVLSDAAGSAGAFSRVGFSPSWNHEFLFITAALFGTGFREAETLVWNREALEGSILYVRDWINGTNNGLALEDDFYFKYFFAPQIKLVQSGRILLTYMESSGLFTLDEELRSGMEFRWMSAVSRTEDGEIRGIPLVENATWYGICRDGGARRAAAAFTRWFFLDETQRFLLQESRRFRLSETVFGIANGFSALRTVTERIFPQFYPRLLGHMPPADSLDPPHILPLNWMAIKHRVIIPWLSERIREQAPLEDQGLEQRIANWIRLNREL